MCALHARDLKINYLSVEIKRQVNHLIGHTDNSIKRMKGISGEVKDTGLRGAGSPRPGEVALSSNQRGKFVHGEIGCILDER